MMTYFILAIALIIFYYWRYPYEIISNHDGDTSTVKSLIGRKFNVRFAVADSNEDSNHLQQAGGKEATAYLNRIMPVGSRVSLVRTSKSGSYDREMIAIIYKGWTDINLQMIKAGHAVIDPRYLKTVSPSMQHRYLKAEERAINKKLGRWSNRKWCAEYPWQFRKRVMSQRKVKRSI